MSDHTNNKHKNLLHRFITVSLHSVKHFTSLLSKQNLTSLPDRLKNIWERLLGSYWFIPTSFVLLGILLAPLLISIDQRLDRETVRDISFAFTGDDDAARAIMTSIAGAVLGVAGTTFSITIAVLSMASSQFGPRLLRNFLTDTSNQLVLGAFIGTFSYSLLVLKSIHKFDVSFGVPQLAVTFAIVMAIICALLLVYFIQHMVHAIQASHVIQGASDDAIANIDYWYSETCDIEHQRDAADKDIDDYLSWAAAPIYAPTSGYLQQIYIDSLIILAKDYGGIIRLQTNLGSFVTDKNIMGYFYQRPARDDSYLQKTKTSNLAIMPRAPDALFWQRFATGIELEQRPSHTNDIGYSLGQITEIAIRALSPGINDPKTAVNCIQSLSSCLSLMMRRQPPSPYHFYHPARNKDINEVTVNQSRASTLAVVTKTPKISDFIDTSLGEIRRYATADLMVLKALCQALTDLNYARVNSAQRQSLLHELKLIEAAGQQNLAYDELTTDLLDMCWQVRQFIQSEDAQHQYFTYTSTFDRHISKALESQSR